VARPGWVAVALPVAATLALTIALVVAGDAPAYAHERRTVGAFQFVVGWGDEPPYTGFKNSVQVTITQADGGAVTELGDALNVEVIKGTERTSLPLVANFRVGGFGTPGDFRAWLTPTRPDAYTFRFTGSIRGQNVDESFSSSKTTFNRPRTRRPASWRPGSTARLPGSATAFDRRRPGPITQGNSPWRGPERGRSACSAR